jgi:hypothetical protein
MEAEPVATVLPELAAAAAAPPPLFVNVPASRLLQVPAALLTDLANKFLHDKDAQSLAQTCSAMPPLLRMYRIKDAVSLSFAVQGGRRLSAQAHALPSLRYFVLHAAPQAAARDEWLESMRIGVPCSVFIDAAASMDRQLREKLQWLKDIVCSVRVRREVFDVTTPSQFRLVAVTSHLPSHVRSLVFEHEFMAPEQDADEEAVALPELYQWTLPAGLTVLQLPHCLWLEDNGAQVQLPASLTKLRLGANLDQSLADWQLPASLRVLHFGAAWSQPMDGWPQLPDGLEELELPHMYPHRLSSLQLPPSLRALLFAPPALDSTPRATHLPDIVTQATFPPRLQRLHLPRSAKAIDLSLLPTTLRHLRFGYDQSLCCSGSDPAATLENLALKTLEFGPTRIGVNLRRTSRSFSSSGRRVYSTIYDQFAGVKKCRAELQRRLPAQVQAAASGVAPSSTAAARAFKMGRSKRA